MSGDEAAARPAPRHLRRPPAGDLWLVAASALLPFAAFLDAHRSSVVAPQRVLLVALVVAVAAAALLVLLLALRPTTPPTRIALPMAVVTTLAFEHGRILDAYPPPDRRWVQLAVAVVLLALVAALTSRVSHHRVVVDAVRLWLAIALAVHVALIVDARAAPADPVPQTGAAVGSGTAPFTQHPDIWWFVLDEHARSDVLASVAGYDDAPLRRGLEGAGVTMSDTSTSSYVRTHLSIPSTLLMDWVAKPGNDIGNEFALADRMINGDNPVMRRLRSEGYEILRAPDGAYEWSSCRTGVIDACLPPHDGLLRVDEVTDALLHLTPLGGLLPLEQRSTDPQRVVDQVQARPRSGPRFVFAHVLAPHTPFRFDPSCQPRRETARAHLLSGEERRAAYATDVRCIDAQLVQAIDRIVAADPDAVVIVQSDHGSKLLGDLWAPPERWSATDRWERFAVLNAAKLPTGCAATIDGEQLVNTFRIVLACLEGSEPDLLEPRWFLSVWDQVRTLVEVEAPLQRPDEAPGR